MKILLLIIGLFILSFLVIPIRSWCQNVTLVKNKATPSECMLGICFKSKLKKIDSLEEWGGMNIEDVNYSGVLLWVFDISKENLSFLKNECKKHGFRNLPLDTTRSIPLLLFDKNLLQNSNGLYRHTEKQHGHYQRDEILNLTQKKYIIFISN